MTSINVSTPKYTSDCTSESDPTYYYAPYYHIYTNDDPCMILESVFSRFIDYVEICSENYPLSTKTYQCDYYIDNDHLTFVVCVYHTKTGYIVEFNRSKGCVIKFNKLYNQLLISLALNNLKFTDSEECKNECKTDLTDLTTIDEVTLTDEEFMETLAIVIELTHHQNSDIRTQAMLSLISFTTAKYSQYHTVLCFNKKFNGIFRLLDAFIDENEDVRRCAIVGLSNILENNATIRESFIAKSAEFIPLVTSILNRTVNKEFIRQTNRLLSLLTPHN